MRENVCERRKKRIKLAIFALFFVTSFIWSMGLKVRAREKFDYDFLEFAPDGMAWTIREPLPNPSDAFHSNPSCWYPNGEVILVGERNEKVLPGVGQHEYSYVRKGNVQVWKWVVTHSPGKCIHNDEGYFHGIQQGARRCLANYYSGWNAYCADCGEKIHQFYIYASREKIKALTMLDLSLDYYYLCPSCDHLEQGCGFEHVCKAISANRYKVVYQPNAGDVSGRMQPSFHVYDNAEVYEGEKITPNKCLNINSFQRRGYVFCGWNLAPDGSGESFQDGQEILNLSEENYDAKTGKGVVNLYAQWKKMTGNLLIDPGEGRYLGKTGTTAVTVGYGEEYHLLQESVTPPKGFLVHYEVMGGKALDEDVSAIMLAGWRLENPFHGILREDTYQFLGEDGETDRVTAIYDGEGILLPLPVREGFSFGGWYFDREYKRLAGREGDRFVPSGDVTLYAQWVDLVLTAKLNLRDHDGKGAVDLSWYQRDEREKTYLLYQRRAGEEFHEIYGATEESERPAEIDVEFTGREFTYEITHSGFYDLKAYGAQGSNVGDFQGGLGGFARGKFYLEAGDQITVFVGGQNGSGGGGTGKTYETGKGSGEAANGGGSTRILSAKNGLLLVAGGGGSASLAENGGAGGTEDGLREDGRPEGENGDVGGGAGWIGGISGTYRVHVHTTACVHVHQGNTQTGGPCYEETTENCTCHLVVKGPFIEWNKSDNCYACIAAGRNGYGSVHPKCWWIEHHGCGASTDYGQNGWWECLICGQVGYTWGSGQNKPTVQDHDYLVTSFVLNCDQTYDCGNPDPVVSPARGGSNYVREELALSYEQKQGMRRGDGAAFIIPVTVGFQEKNELEGVFAPDLEAPCRIDPDHVEMVAAGNGKVHVRFEKPKDRGTIYYHQAESYLAGSDKLLSSSNVTETEVISGVAGYYYLIDEKEHASVTKENVENAAAILKETSLEMEMSDGKKYLHLAPVDYAGNVGESIDVSLCLCDAAVCWGVETNPIQVTSRIADREYGSVYAADEKTYFVRADGSTPFLLSFEAELLGAARRDYQIDHLAYSYALLDALSQGSYHLYLPHGEIISQEAQMTIEDMGRTSQGRDLLCADMYGQAVRTHGMQNVTICQSFVMDLSCHGRKVMVTPSAGASFEGGEQCSEKDKDLENGILLIGDGEAPEIGGVEHLDELFHAWHGGAECVTIELTAADALSGVATFWLEAYQINTTEAGVFHAGTDGRIRINLDENDTLFSGDVTIVVHAIDLVGNSVALEYSVKEFELKTEIIRLLEPHVPIFKRGESGMLKVTVKGYADTLEITFPEAFSSEDPGLNRVIHYDDPKELVREEITFMIPLRLAEDGAYQVTVTARKGAETLVSRPELSTFSVAGNLLGELRTRLR